MHEAFSRYLEKRESQREYLELAQQSRAKLEKDLAEIEHSIDENDREWKILLEKELADYPPIIIGDKKRGLTVERDSLLCAKAKIEAQLNALPQVDLVEVELALGNLAKPWRICNTGGYYVPHPMSWERRSVADGNWRPDMPRKLTSEQTYLLRETLMKLNCRIAVRNGAIFISGSLPLTGVRANEAPL